MIKKDPKELIDYLDKSITLRKLKLKADVNIEAIKNGMEMKDGDKLYEMDKYSQEVEKFIERRLKYEFKDSAQFIYERLSTDSSNCNI